MRVEVVEHNPKWRKCFESESARILDALGDNAIRAHHVGSTAIPTIYAKPIIDIMIEVSSISSVDEHNLPMETLGYEVMGEYGIPGRRYFRKEDQRGKRLFHLHVFESGDSQVERHLLFRDFMIAHPDWAQQYSKLKKDLAHHHSDSFDQYMDGKDSFIKNVDQLAADWNTNQRVSSGRDL